MNHRFYPSIFHGKNHTMKRQVVPDPRTLETIGSPFANPRINRKLFGGNMHEKSYAKNRKVLGTGFGA